MLARSYGDGERNRLDDSLPTGWTHLFVASPGTDRDENEEFTRHELIPVATSAAGNRLAELKEAFGAESARLLEREIRSARNY